MMTKYQYMKDIINLQLKLCREGFIAIYKNNLVDVRVYDEAELFEPQAVKEIIIDLETELIKIGKLEDIEKEGNKQYEISKFYDLILKNDRLKSEVEDIQHPYNGQIRILKEERDEATSEYITQINENEKKLLKTCPHLESVIINEYIEGGYLDTGKHIKIRKCSFCCKELDKEVSNSGYS